MRISPAFKPKWALELLYPLYADVRRMRKALPDTSQDTNSPQNGELDKNYPYTPNIIGHIRGLVDEEFANRRAEGKKQAPPIVAFRTSKGGVGKTTICANVGACAAAMGYKVLMIDAAPQCSLSVMYQIDVEDQELQTIKHACFYDVPIKDLMKKVAEDSELYLVPADQKLAEFDYLAITKPNRERILAKTLSHNAKTLCDFDIILVDCDPGTSQLNLNVLLATTDIAAVVALDGLSLKALEHLQGELELVNDMGVVPNYFFIANKFYPSYSHTIENLKIVKRDYGEFLMDVQIPDAVAFSRQIRPGRMNETMPLFFHPKEAGSQAWRSILDLTKLILRTTHVTN